MGLVRVVLHPVNKILFILAGDDSAAMWPKCVKVIGTFLRGQSGDVCCWAVALVPRHRVCDARGYHGVPEEVWISRHRVRTLATEIRESHEWHDDADGIIETRTSVSHAMISVSSWEMARRTAQR